MAKILIIDDDPETIKLLEAIVMADGHEAKSIQESRNAIQAVGSYHPDLVLLDIMMPEINGIGVCKLIKSNPDHNRVKVMMVSALNDEGSKRDSFNAGADQFVTKPILPKAFTRQINEILKN
jgi:two-component system alkaline phosphatase synthesis response regulator PhoP